MTNTSFNKISELMMPDRAAESRASKTAGSDQASSEVAGQRFDQLLRAAGNDRPRESMQQELRRPEQRSSAPSKDRSKPAVPDRFDKPSSADRPQKSDRRRPDPDRQDRAESDTSTEERVSSTDRDRDDRVRSTDEDATTTDDVNQADEATTAEDAEATTSEDEATSDASEDAAADGSDEAVATETTIADELVEGASTDESVETDQESMVVSDAAAEKGESEESVETVDTDAVDAAPVEVEADADIDEATEDDEAAVENAEVDGEAAAVNNAAAQAAATATTVDPDSVEVVADEDADIAIESSEQAEAATELAVEEGPGTVAQTLDGETGEADAVETIDGADGSESADESNLDSEAQPESQDQQQTDGADNVETPLAAGAQVTNVQGTTQAGTATSTIGGLTEVVGTGEVGTAAGTQVAGTAPAEEADGADPLWRQVRRAMGSIRNLPTGEQQLTIRLRPDDLGSVVVRISTGEAGTTVALVADSAVAASQLSQQRQQLIRELEDGGLSGVAVDIGTSGDTQPGDGDETELSQTGGAIGTAAGSDSVDGTARAYGERRVARNSEGLIDVDL